MMQARSWGPLGGRREGSTLYTSTVKKKKKTNRLVIPQCSFSVGEQEPGHPDLVVQGDCQEAGGASEC